ncbi:4Fe-4S binding protein [Kiloniella laminariae]|uniref:4Fe-4S binding protein n=1 Tax=Kiloniella laminariae TaxID=454162 RepID=UPI000363AF48|nr:4Fe-4S binding protein [Kiloniella laminariae]
MTWLIRQQEAGLQDFHPEFKHAVDALIGVIPNAEVGSFRLSGEIIDEMPTSPAQKMRPYQESVVTCFAIPITEDSLWIWHKHGENRSLMANYVLGLAARSIIDRLAALDNIKIEEITALVGQELSMVRLGELAGLGRRGWNNLLIHPEWGAWLQIHAVIGHMSAPLASELATDVCIHCGNCIRACPVKAVKPHRFNPVACSSVVAAPTRRKSKAIALTENSYIECRECIKSCPIGSAPEEIFEWKH